MSLSQLKYGGTDTNLLMLVSWKLIGPLTVLKVNEEANQLNEKLDLLLAN